jgi:hypothetical protein
MTLHEKSLNLKRNLELFNSARGILLSYQHLLKSKQSVYICILYQVPSDSRAYIMLTPQNNQVSFK